MHKLIPLLVLLATAEWAQTQDNRNYSQTFPIRVDQQTPGTCQMWEFFIASTDGHVYECWSPNKWGNLITLNFPRGATASLPATCNVGDPFIATDATSTEQLYICTSANTWTQQTGSGGGVSSCSATGANWLSCAITTGNLNLTATTGQASHQVIGTCGFTASFAPCSLTSAELPLSSMGTITGGTWSGSVVAGAYGGTGVNNGSFTATLSGNLTFTGAFNPTFAIPSSSTWNFPIGGGTLALIGTDINSLNQVTSTHLSAALPFNQGGLGTSTNFAAHTWFGNNTGSTAAPSPQQPACADLSNAANSCSTDATNASNITAGSLGYGRLPTPAAGGPAGVVAVLTAATGAISNTATQVIGYSVPSGTFATGTTYTIEAWGSETTSTSPGNDTFSIEIGAGSLSGNTIVSNAPAAAASVSGSPLWVRGTITVFPSVVSGALTVCATTSGALSGTCKVAILNSATITAGQSNVIELVYQSGASTSSIAFSAAKITLEKP